MAWKDRKKLTVAAAAVSAAVLLAIGSTAAYLTDTDTQRNVITIGRASITLTEPGYTDSQTVVPGSIVTKDPTITNDGTVDEFVFIKVDAPQDNVTLLGTDGKPLSGLTGAQQIFKVISEQTGALSITSPEGQNVDFTYAPNWVLLTANSAVSQDGKTRSYIFGYKTRLSPGKQTVPIFDKVQLRSFIDAEITGVRTIGVTGYAIQDRNLGIDGIETLTVLDEDKLTAIYAIVARKAAG